MLVTLLTVAEIVYVVALSIWIILEKRRPTATIAWILSLALLPLVGFGLYYALGPRRMRRNRSARASAIRRIRASVPDLGGLFGPAHGLVREQVDLQTRQLMALALNNSEAPLSAGNDVRVLRNGFETFAALETAVREARHHIHFEYYIFNADSTGRRFRDLLVERAKAGVQVRLLVDAIGSADIDDAFLEPLLAAGGEAGVFNPVSFARFRPSWNFRNHRKIVVIDGRVAFCGGLNIGDEYANVDPHSGPWRDTHLGVEGPAVRALALLFLEDWHFATGRSVTTPIFFAAPAPVGGTQLVQIVGSGPDRDWPPIQQIFFSAISNARDRVLITTPYFVPDEAILTAITTAALRGVDVKILVPRRIDSRVVLAAGRSYFDDLLRAGARIYEYLPGPLHSKTMSIDGRLATIGTANLDQRSFRLNFEVDALIYDVSVANEVEVLFHQDLTLSREVTAESRRELAFSDRLFEGCARLLSPLL